MRQISSWGLGLFVFCALEVNAHAAETPSTGAVGLGLTIGGGATALVSGTVLLATYSCRPDARGEGCPPRGDRTAAAVAFVAGVLMLAVGIPLYLTSGQDAKAAGDRQLATAFNSMNLRLAF